MGKVYEISWERGNVEDWLRQAMVARLEKRGYESVVSRHDVQGVDIEELKHPKTNDIISISFDRSGVDKRRMEIEAGDLDFKAYFKEVEEDLKNNIDAVFKNLKLVK